MKYEKSPIDKLNEIIKGKKLNGVFFLYGEEQFLIDLKIQEIINKTVTPGTEMFNVIKFNGDNASADKISAATDQFPQMSPMKVILISDTGILNNSNINDFKALKSVCSELPSDTCVIFKEKEFDEKRHSGNIGFIKNSGGVFKLTYLPANKLSVYVDKFFQKNDTTILNSDISYFINLCGRSLGKINAECNKLLLYLGDRKKVTREDIDLVVSKSTETRTYEMIDNMVAGRTGKAYEQLKYLSDARTNPNTILSIMTSKLSELLMCKLLLEDGLSNDEIREYYEYKPFDFVLKKAIQDSKRFDEGYLKYMVSKGLSYDYKSKLGQIDPWTAVEMYLSELTK